jgi:hypothetical protein
MQYEQAVYVNTETGELVDVQQLEAQEDGFVQLTETELLAALVEENKKLNGIKAKIKALCTDNKYHKKKNPDGLDGEVVKKTAKSAVRYAAADYEEKKQEQLEFFAFYEQVTDYNE